MSPQFFVTLKNSIKSLYVLQQLDYQGSIRTYKKILKSLKYGKMAKMRPLSSKKKHTDSLVSPS